MSFSNRQYPYNTVVYITDTINGSGLQGSGVLISPDEVLTASHLLWENPFVATNVKVSPGYNQGSAPYGTISASWFHYFQVQDSGGVISGQQSQFDYAIIHLSSPVNVGYMGYESNFSGGAVHVTGYPTSSGGQETDYTETVSLDQSYSLLDGGDTGHGSSGGPLWVQEAIGPYVVGIVSSGNGSTGYNVQITTSVFNQIQAWIAQDDTVDPLVPVQWYDAQNPDAASATMSAAYHYHAYGWHEGRNPDAFFSTFGYLTANPDVRVAGEDPLSHFEESGWREGRDPSASFDDRLYLLHNPDVARAGIDPLVHYLANGQSEGRSTYQAIGPAGSIAAHGGFDAEFYLLSNPDVARAALGVSDTMSFAYNHYETHGWREGRNPDAWFDVKGYLTAYADVAAAHIDPLQHYINSGWRENRDPSAAFDTKTYDAQYSDVRASGMNPLLHYLEFGAFEGRSTFGDGVFR